MKEQYTTYTVGAKQRPDIWVFKYHLNGVLKSFEVLEGVLGDKQVEWLFRRGNFPYRQSQIEKWPTDLKDYFKVDVGLPDISFDAFWESYGQKTKKTRSSTLWKKLSDADRIKALEGIRRYNNYLRLHNGIAKMNPDTYLYQRRWEDEFTNS
ncbi:hypothetical protein [Spongiimicrobium salis]|uniref:hypothetical protein n=1 Tax=Spongiimicrobium salis TaxID=1667022 RepID=UPI00374CC3DA